MIKCGFAIIVMHFDVVVPGCLWHEKSASLDESTLSDHVNERMSSLVEVV